MAERQPSDQSGDETERNHPANASIKIAAQEGSSRFYVHTPKGGIMSVPAMNEEQAVELAADEYPSHDLEEFEPVTDFCEHDRPMAQGCLKCGRSWGDY